jgi:hypothetical protein
MSIYRMEDSVRRRKADLPDDFIAKRFYHEIALTRDLLGSPPMTDLAPKVVDACVDLILQMAKLGSGSAAKQAISRLEECLQ